MFTVANILLGANLILGFFIFQKVNELWEKKRSDDRLTEIHREQEEERAMLESYGSWKNILAQNPDYILRKCVKEFKALVLKDEVVSDFASNFISASTSKKEKMFNDRVPYALAAPEAKKRIIREWNADKKS